MSALTVADQRPARVRFRPTILVLDDDVDICASLDALLSSDFPDADVVTASSGEEALALMRGRGVDLALVDYRLPNVQGLDLLRTMRQRHSDVTLVLMTAFPDLKVVSEAWSEGWASGFMAKPFDVKEVRDVVARLLSKRAGRLGRIPPWRA